jgi:hypothetical protein
MEEAARKATWDTNAKETNQLPPFEIVIVIDMNAVDKKPVRNYRSTILLD